MPFALFGIGDYTFAPWKVSVSGMHPTVRFSLIGPVGGKPVLFDDASYFLAFESEEEARVITDVLNSRICQDFLSSLIFTDSKRPVTVELLQRLDLTAIAKEAGLAVLWAKARNTNISYNGQSRSFQPEFVMEKF